MYQFYLAASRLFPVPIFPIEGGGELAHNEVDDFHGGAPIVDEDVDATSDAGFQRKAADQAPPADPFELQGASQLHSGHEEEKADLLRKLRCKVSWLREIVHLYNDEVEEWFCKYMKYKGHQETRITAILQRHFPLSNIAGYNLAQDKIIYVWDVQRRERAIKDEKERKKQLTKEAALPSCAHCSLKLY